MIISLARLEDLLAIDNIALQVHELHVKWRPDIFSSVDHIITENELSNLIDKREIFVARIDRKVVGYIIISTRESRKLGYPYRKELNIDAMGVDENFRNLGIGNELLEFIKEFAKRNAYTDIRLTVNEENAGARHLYEKKGFRVKNIVYSMKVEK